jgi:predicted anti-sigma-YlaC factor YlaD
MSGPFDQLVCREVVELVSDYLEGALDAVDRARFEEHLAMCEGCSAYLDQMRTTVRLAGMVTPEALAPPFRDRLLEAFRDWRRAGGPSPGA